MRPVPSPGAPDVARRRSPRPLKPLIAAAAQAVLLGLKLSGAVSWPWWLILAPAAITAASVVALGAVLIALGAWGRS